MKKIANILIGSLVTVFLVWFLLKQISLRELQQIFSEIPLIFILLAFAAYVCSFVFRSLKFKILLGDLSFRETFSIACVHNMMLNILPARTGELYFVYLVKKRGLKGAKAASALLISRIFDFISVAILFLAFYIFIDKVSITIEGILHIIVFFVLLVIVCLFCVVYFGDFFFGIAKKLVSLFEIDKFKWVSFLLEKIEFLIKSFEIVKLHRKFFVVLLISLGVFASQLSMMYLLLIGMRVELPFLSALLALTMLFIFNIVPIQSLAGLGTFEGFWTFAFMLVGLNKNLAISSGFIQHILSILFFLAVGFYGMMQLRLSRTAALKGGACS